MALPMSALNARERFHAVMNFDTSVRTLKWEFGYWADTLKRWYDEGLPRSEGIPDGLKGGEEIFGEGIPWRENAEPFAGDVHDFFEMDKGFERVPVNLLFEPPFENRVVDEDDEHRIVIDEMGIKKRIRKDESSIPQFLEWPVKNLGDWERLKEERLQPNVDERLPENMARLVDRYRDRDFPLTIGGYPHGFFGTLRFLMGDELLFTGYYDQPDLIHDINATLCDLWITVFEAVLNTGIELDCVDIWEDMSYRSGPLISPDHFTEYMMPYYKKLSTFLEGRFVKNIWVDTDGDCWKLIPLFLEGGITGLSPMEVQSGMDIVSVRKRYPNLQIYGGIDKRIPVQSNRQIDKEIEGKIPFMLKMGGFVPYLDHLIPPDVPWNGFMYYRRKLNEYIMAN
jgi:uroporphyrinogen decarboxylase